MNGMDFMIQTSKNPRLKVVILLKNTILSVKLVVPRNERLDSE